jgi:hypothetical protein
MAQIISSPGQNQVFGNVVVAPATSEVGNVADTKVKATATIVKYGQTEPGRGITGSDPLRS